MTITFPKGTPAGHAFASVPQLLEWLNSCAAGDNGPELQQAFGDRIRTAAPIAAATYPLELIAAQTEADVRDYCEQLGKRYPDRFDDTEYDIRQLAARRIDPDGNARWVAPGLFAYLAGSLLDDIYIPQARKISGWVIACRQQLKYAKQRRHHAKQLGALEAVEGDAWALVLDTGNRWAATVFADMKNAGLDVQLEDQAQPKTPAGRFRLGY